MRLLAGATALAATIGLGTGAASAHPAGGAVSPISGNGRHDALYGDVTQDGIPDRVMLGGADPIGDTSRCTLLVEPGLAAGGYGPAETHHYDGTSARLTGYCPDMGVVLPDGRIVVAGFLGGDGLIVLSDFQRVGSYPTNTMPSFIGTEDFNGDGRADVWESTDQQDILTTYVRAADGSFTPGPLAIRAFTSGYFAEMEGRPGRDVVAVTHRLRPTPDYDYAVVVGFGRSGHVVTLAENSDAAYSGLTVRQLVGGPLPDVRFTDPSGRVRTFQNLGHERFRDVTSRGPAGQV